MNTKKTEEYNNINNDDIVNFSDINIINENDNFDEFKNLITINDNFSNDNNIIKDDNKKDNK